MEIEDGRKNNSFPNGAGPGIPKGTELPTKRTYDADKLADTVASQLVQGKQLRRNPQLAAVTEYDRRNLARITGESVEVFNERLAQKLRLIADKVTDRIEQKVDADQFKTGELGFILSVAHDKRLSLDGSRALNNASVNIQVNNYGQAPRDMLMGELDGLGLAKRVVVSTDADLIVSPAPTALRSA